jgi:hypothetical protein
MTRWLIALALPVLARAQFDLYACATMTKEYVVGAKLPPSGLFVHRAEWQHEGYNHPFIFSLDYDPADPSTLYLAAGNGLIRASKQGWKLLTGSDVTELRDVFVDRSDGAIYYAYSHGVRVSRDRGVTWTEIGAALHRKFTATVRASKGLIVIGGEEGVFRSTDQGATWNIAGAAGFQVTRVEQSPHNACDWMAATQGGGIFVSHDCAVTFENAGRTGVGATLYDVAYDPTRAQRIAVAGIGPGVVISEDGGKSWTARNAGLPATEVVSVIFDPGTSGWMYASVRDEGLYVSRDGGMHWSRHGLEGSVVNRMGFVPR